MKNLLFYSLIFWTAALAAQPGNDITVRDDAKVGFISTGTGANINVTQIFGKSPEYAELKKRLDGLEAAIAKKADRCEKYTDALAKEDCRAELIALNAERGSVQKIETRFREDVIRLAETFATIPINSERLRLAKQFFDEGKIREADNVLNAKEMQAEGDALLAKKAREQEALQLTDSLLRVKADEFALKARLKATDYGDSLRYDSAVIYFEQSRRYGETVENLSAFADLLRESNQTLQSIIYYERALEMPLSDSENANLCMNLGIAYFNIQKMAESEERYLRSLEINERLVESIPEQVEPDLAKLASNLGVFYFSTQKMTESEKMYLRSLEIYERLAKSNPERFEIYKAKICLNLGSFYFTIDKIPEAEKLFLHTLETCERLVKGNPEKFEPDLAMTAANLGNLYYAVQKFSEAEKISLRSLEIYERLSNSDPAQFEPYLGSVARNLAVIYKALEKMREAEKMYGRSLEIFERLAKSNPAQFEPDLAITVFNLGNFFLEVQKMPEAEKMYQRSMEIFERLSKQNPAQFEPALAITLNNFGKFQQTNNAFSKAQDLYSRALSIRKNQMLNGQSHFREALDLVYGNMASLRNSFEKIKNYDAVVAIQLDRAICMDSLSTLDVVFLKRAANDYGSISWYAILARKYSEAKAAGEKALSIDPSQNWVHCNFGHIYLLQHKWSKAKIIYKKFLSVEKDPVAAKSAIVKDFDYLEAAGITCPEMAKARAWLRN